MIDQIFNISFISVISFIVFVAIFGLILFILTKKVHLIKDENEVISILGSVFLITCFLSGISFSLLFIIKLFLT